MDFKDNIVSILTEKEGVAFWDLTNNYQPALNPKIFHNNQLLNIQYEKLIFNFQSQYQQKVIFFSFLKTIEQGQSTIIFITNQANIFKIRINKN